MKKRLAALLLAIIASAWPCDHAEAVLKSAGVGGILSTSNGGSGQASALFSPASYKQSSDPDDTNSIQAATNAAEAAGGCVIFDNKRYQISALITHTGPLCVRGAGYSPFYNASGNYDYPWMVGSVIEQDAPATDVFEVTANLNRVDIKIVGITFGESIIFSNTGSCIHGVPGNNPAGGYNQGTDYSAFENVGCFGNDGNHYAFDLTNSLYSFYNRLYNWGGGFFQFTNYTSGTEPPARQDGNFTALDMQGYTFLAGTANGVNFINNNGSSSTSYSNYFWFGRLQQTTSGLGTTLGTGSHQHTIAVPLTTQYTLKIPSGFFHISCLDLEPATAPVQMPTPPTGSWSVSPCGSGYTDTNGQNFPSLQTIMTGQNGVSGASRHQYSDLSFRNTQSESAGSVVPLYMDAANQAPTYAQDGSRVFTVPDVMQPFAGPSGNRWATYNPGLGAWFYDTTLGKPAYYAGSGNWVDGAGNALTAPASGATAANDNFARTASVLGQSVGGQQWTIYTGLGTPSWSTNGTYAKYTGPTNTFTDSLAWLFTHNYNGKACVTWALMGAQPFLIFRLSDRNNYWKVGPTNTQKVVNNAATAVVASYTTNPSSGSVVCAVLSGSSITITNNGSTIGTGTDTFNQTATGYGIGVRNDNTSEFESFAVTNP